MEKQIRLGNNVRVNVGMASTLLQIEDISINDRKQCTAQAVSNLNVFEVEVWLYHKFNDHKDTSDTSKRYAILTFLYFPILNY